MSNALLTPTARLILHALADNQFRPIIALKRMTGTTSDGPLRSALKVLQATGQVVDSPGDIPAFYRLAPQPWDEQREKEIEQAHRDARRQRLRDAEVYFSDSLTPAAWVELGFDDSADEAEAKLVAAVSSARTELLDKYEEQAGMATWTGVPTAESQAAIAPLDAALTVAENALSSARAERVKATEARKAKIGGLSYRSSAPVTPEGEDEFTSLMAV